MKSYIRIFIVCVIVSTLYTCKKDGACENGTEDFVIAILDQDVFKTYSGSFSDNEDVFYYRNFFNMVPKVQFYLGAPLDQICTETHLGVNYFFALTSAPQPVPLIIRGHANWYPLIGYDEIILANGLLQPDQETQGDNNHLEIGLKQVFPEGAAKIDLYISVEFESFGSFTQDSAYFRQHIKDLSISSHYDKF